MANVTRAELEAGLDGVRAAPANDGTLELIVRRPAPGERELLAAGTLDLEAGLVGDGWAVRPASSRRPGGPNPDAQVTVMSARAAALVAGPDQERWAQAGDQLYVDFDISVDNLSAGSRLEIGAATLEVTEAVHTGCGKFVRRFGVEAMKLISSKQGRALRLRGLNARVVVPGPIAQGDVVRKLEPG
jgi:MOSC domain-containing protein YiiM